MSRAAPSRVCAALVATLLCSAAPVLGQERGVVSAVEGDGFGRLIVEFPDRLDLPAFRLQNENGVVSVVFSDRVAVALPPLGLSLPDYLSAARSDPDGQGVRFGLRWPATVNTLQAGEKLFIDLLPEGWQGLPPGLPPEVVEELAIRARDAALRAEQNQRAADARRLGPEASLRVGRNPTFIRLQFDWSVDTAASFDQDGARGVLRFDWPVPVDLYALQNELPSQILAVENAVGPDGSEVVLTLADGVAPRFYATGPRQFVVDIDISPEEGALFDAEVLAAALTEANIGGIAPLSEGLAGPAPVSDVEPEAPVTPVVTLAGETVRIGFPFQTEIAAAVFRRGDVVWMLFDTEVPILEPATSATLNRVASGLSINRLGSAQLLRLDLRNRALATLASEGRSWILSLGDVLLNATEPMDVSRRRDRDGEFEVTAELGRPGRVHAFNDPVVGDTLSIATVYPPARGIVRSLEHVEFSILRSVHGLVVRPQAEGLRMALEDDLAVISLPDGLTVSAIDAGRARDARQPPESRASYLDLGLELIPDIGRMAARGDALAAAAAAAEGPARDQARLDLARFYLSNRFAHEALGVLDVLESELTAEPLRRSARLTRAIASTMAERHDEALTILNAPAFADESDALMWRAMARASVDDFEGARRDALAAEAVIGAYPLWIRQRFLLSTAQAAIETADIAHALRAMGNLEFARLDPEQVTQYQLLSARIAESEGRFDEALETYGQVIAADIRPTRAEAVYRTLALLDGQGRLDLDRATETLAGEILMWRGNRLEADMQRLLAILHFRNGDYRDGFQTVRQAVSHYPENAPIDALLTQAKAEFSHLYLDGGADRLDPVDALALFYDFRELTPPGPEGDEMIRNLAQRLVKVDLLAQAGDLLEYQIESRLQGAARAEVAADLAVIRIAQRDPESALQALHRTRLTELPPSLDRQRRILEARALIDAGREELAVDLLSRVTGRDADLLRVSGYWAARNYGAAAELLERLYAPEDPEATASRQARMNIVKAAVGYVLGNDRLGLQRLRQKFAERLVGTGEWAVFDFVTGDEAPQSAEFRKLVREISGLDTLNAFLTAYRELYPVASAMTPQTAVSVNDQV
ncbi:hypothetical protein EMQ25_08335 [Arsenicitalea aurantiaca]|uniref:Tetratricopeptide repeat protein n=1 Tax=Arsenicitalea aurantiaca TaxID=1783274 RepID=A0A433XGD3_9HYPH|nr:hypothetical protein [Arsenicitalea aurantiaca]RUT33120.1 hypothetical protein EMQ25_08335 [Arsenicitalea aurantiaca]